MPGPISGGSSSSATPALPVWTYAGIFAGTVAATKFRADNADPASVLTLYFSTAAKNGGSDFDGFIAAIPTATLLILTDSTGKSLIYSVGSHSSGTGYQAFGVVAIGVPSGTFSGDYSLSVQIIPSLLDTTTNAINLPLVDPLVQGKLWNSGNFVCVSNPAP